MHAPNPYAPPVAVYDSPHRAIFQSPLASIGARVQASLLDGVLSFVVALPSFLFLSATDS
jgi:uncharacterized RDD family membrane protein YckC